MKKSVNNIRSSRLFANVTSDVETLNDKKLKIINIDVEKPTGEIFAALTDWYKRIIC